MIATRHASTGADMASARASRPGRCSDRLNPLLPVFEADGLQTIKAAGSVIVSVPGSANGHHLLGMVPSREEAAATILRLFNPN